MATNPKQLAGQILGATPRLSKSVRVKPVDYSNAPQRATLFSVPKSALIYEGDEEPDIPWFVKNYSLDFKYNGDGFDNYDVEGEPEDLDRFYDDHMLESYGIKRWGK